MSPVRDVAAIRLDNALLLFDEFVRSTVKHADAATLRGLERRFAERLQIQPSYWSQIKGRSRQIGERLARQFEHCCNKPALWMDQAHGSLATEPTASAETGDAPVPRDDDERFIVGLVLTYYRRHPQRARTRLLDLLGEVLVPAPAAPVAASVKPAALKAPAPGLAKARPAPTTDEAHALWLATQAGIAPLKKRR